MEDMTGSRAATATGGYAGYVGECPAAGAEPEGTYPAAPEGAEGICSATPVDQPSREPGQMPCGEAVTPGTDPDGQAPGTSAPADDGAPPDGGEDATDYAALAAADLAEIKRMAPSLAGLSHLAELPNALRYAALRDAGLSVEEALYAACHAFVTPRAADNRAHLRSAVPIGAAGTPSPMTAAEMREARELFGDLTEGEIERLYARCQSE